MSISREALADAMLPHAAELQNPTGYYNQLLRNTLAFITHARAAHRHTLPFDGNVWAVVVPTTVFAIRSTISAAESCAPLPMEISARARVAVDLAREVVATAKEAVFGDYLGWLGLKEDVVDRAVGDMSFYKGVGSLTVAAFRDMAWLHGGVFSAAARRGLSHGQTLDMMKSSKSLWVLGGSHSAADEALPGPYLHPGQITIASPSAPGAPYNAQLSETVHLALHVGEGHGCTARSIEDPRGSFVFKHTWDELTDFLVPPSAFADESSFRQRAPSTIALSTHGSPVAV